MRESVDTAVLGAGMTGLCTAYYLAKRRGNDAVLVLESGERVGGTSWTAREEGFVCEAGPNGFLDKEPKTLQWAEDLGIGGNLLRANEECVRRFICRDNVLHEIKPPLAFLASPLLSLRGRARLLCEPLIRRKRDETPETIWEFAARRIGREAADTLVAPMVSGVYGGDAKALSLAHCFPKMAEMEREYGGLFKALIARKRANKNGNAMGPAGTLTSFQDGIGVFPETAARALGDRVRTRNGAVAMRQENGRYIIETATGAEIEARSVVVAIPAYAAAKLVEGLDKRLAGTLESIPYAGMAVLCTGYPREKVGHDLNGFGFLIPRNQGLRALGCLWSSTIFPGRAPEGWVMLRSMYGGYTDPEAVTLGDAALLEALRLEIHPLLGIGCAPEFHRIYRWPRGIPQYLMGHGARLNVIEEAEKHLPGLIFAGNAYRGVSLNDCVVSAHRAVEMACQHLGD